MLTMGSTISCKITIVLLTMRSEAEFKEIELWLKFRPRLKYGWFQLYLHSIFQDLRRRSIETGFFWGDLRRGLNSLNSSLISYLPQTKCLTMNGTQYLRRFERILRIEMNIQEECPALVGGSRRS